RLAPDAGHGRPVAGRPRVVGRPRPSRRPRRPHRIRRRLTGVLLINHPGTPTRMARRGTGGVIFDVDGTLVDSTYLQTVAWWQAVAAYGHEVPMHMIHKSIGLGADRILEHLLGDERDFFQDDRIIDAHGVLYSAFWARLRPLPGAAHLLRECA